MAGGTGWIGRAEGRAGVAAVAGNTRMRAVQNKSCAEMIERLLRFCGQLQQQEDKKCGDQDSLPVEGLVGEVPRLPIRINHCSDLTSLKVLSPWQRPQSGPNSPS